MAHPNQSAPSPDLRIVAVDHLYPHEEHDSQRSQPLLERLRQEATMINPPIVASIDDEHYVILDGANRCHAIHKLGCPHILVQVVSYESGTVELSTWNHIVSRWSMSTFLDCLNKIDGVHLVESPDSPSLARIHCADGRSYSVAATAATARERNLLLRQTVAVYQHNAVLHRTALAEADDIWDLYPDALALVVFPEYQPADIIAAAREQAYLPPGISRHIVHGRAIRVNYPMSALRSTDISLKEKNAELQTWLRQRIENRQVRYYAESTYQFDE